MSDNPNLPTKSESEPEASGAKTRREHVNRQLVKLRREFSGPLPPPGILEGYEKICPGAAQRLIKMAEEESAHRRKIRDTVVAASVSEGKRAQWMAFTIVLGFLIAGVVLGVYGEPISGTILGSVGVATIVVAFLKHRSGMSKESKESTDSNG